MPGITHFRFFMIFQGPWKATLSSKGARDYASYHYAVQAAWEGENPYQTSNLHRRAREEQTRRSVHPFFYPPPSLISMLWIAPFPLIAGYRLFFWVNQLLLLFSFWQIHKWLKTPIWFLAGLALFFTPLADSMKMGQLNIWILALLSFGLARNSGLILGYASMSKMSPALLFFQWIAQRNWKPALACAISVPLFSILALPLVGFDAQKQFFQGRIASALKRRNDLEALSPALPQQAVLRLFSWSIRPEIQPLDSVAAAVKSYEEQIPTLVAQCESGVECEAPEEGDGDGGRSL